MSLATGEEGQGEGGGSLWEDSPPPPSESSLYSIFPRPKNSLAEDTFNNIFLIKKIQPQALHLSIRFALPFPGLRPRGELHGGAGPRAVLGAVGLLRLKQRHCELGPAPQPLQVAEAAAVVELLAEPWATVPQGELLHQPWLHGPEEVEP